MPKRTKTDRREFSDGLPNPVLLRLDAPFQSMSTVRDPPSPPLRRGIAAPPESVDPTVDHARWSSGSLGSRGSEVRATLETGTGGAQMHSSRYILGILGLLAIGDGALAAPGQSGWFMPDPAADGRIGARTGDTWTVRAALGGGYAWWFTEQSHGLTMVEAGVQPLRGVQVAGAMSLQVDGRPRFDPAYLVVSATVPSEAPTKVAFHAGVGGFSRHTGAGAGFVISNQEGAVGWDVGWTPVAIEITPKWGWAELQGRDRTPAWDLHVPWTTLRAGLSTSLTKRFILRVGIPDGFVFSYASRHLTIDVGGASVTHLFGAFGAKIGGRF